MDITITNDYDFFKLFPTEDSCREYLEKKRWNGKPTCVRCEHEEKIYYLKSRSYYKCSKCGKQFKVTHGTMFHGSQVKLEKWFYAIYLFNVNSTGISSVNLAKRIGVEQRTAWLMLHKIREAVKSENSSKFFTGTVECDEAYIGAKPRRDLRLQGKRSKTKDFYHIKSIYGIKDRKTKEIYLEFFDRRMNCLTSKFALNVMKERVHDTSTIYTDECPSYAVLNDSFKEHINIVKNRIAIRRNEQGLNYCSWIESYVDEYKDIHVNGIESVWHYLRKLILGTYYNFDDKNTERYLGEFVFRWNTRARSMSNAEKLDDVISRGMNTVLTYPQLRNATFAHRFQ